MLVAGEIVGVAALNIEDTDTFALEHEGYGEFGANIFDGVDVAFVFGSVADADRVSGGGGSAGDSLAHGDAQILGEVVGIANGEAVL